MRRRICIGAMLLGVAVACKPDEPGIVGRWRNRTAQLMIIDKELGGTLYQENPCAPVLRVKVKRDPYEAYAFLFLENQPVFFPLAQKALFAPSEYFCASKDSVPMCRFCRVEGDAMDCNTTEQKITGHSAMVTHDCKWERVQGTGTSTTTCSGDAATYSCVGTPERDAGPSRDAIPLPETGGGDAGLEDSGAADGGDPGDAGVAD